MFSEGMSLLKELKDDVKQAIKKDLNLVRRSLCHNHMAVAYIIHPVQMRFLWFATMTACHCFQDNAPQRLAKALPVLDPNERREVKLEPSSHL